ncbi:MAG: transglutaminase-like domain-containing protein [Fimbriiglobus sp.]|nr:transglutaminase-like domain-containing protein [Fimbriiglobus sp.]
MTARIALLCLAFTTLPSAAADPVKWWADPIEKSLGKAGDNRREIEKALYSVPKDQRAGMAFLVEHMPDADLKGLKADFLLANTKLAYAARAEFPWGKEIPEDLFLNDVLPYANVDEKRDPWRQEMYDLCKPLVKDCKTPTEAVMALNAEVFKLVDVRYSTQRKKPNQSVTESRAIKMASCTGLSIILVDACRAVGVPARLVGTALWANKSGNHTWVEVWDKDWKFTGACEPDKDGLNRGWFVGNAGEAKKDDPKHAIYAASYKKTEAHFPLVWAMSDKTVPGVNVTDRYAKPKAAAFKLMVKVTDANGKRLVRSVTVIDAAKKELTGKSNDDTADANNHLTFELTENAEVTVTVGDQKQTITTGKAGDGRLLEFKVK